MLEINPIKLNKDQELMELDLIFEKDTKFQQMKLYNNGEDKLVLTLDSFIQFIEGEDEQIYHDTLTRPAFEFNTKAKKFLILGGGDGLVARNLFKLQPEAVITVVDIDDEVVKFCGTNERIIKMNEGSLDKCFIFYEDALKWVPICEATYDMIILDFPDPNSDELNRLYKKSFIYNIIQLLIKKKGVISIQTHEDIADDVFEIVSEFTKQSKAVNYQMPFLSGGVIVIGQC